MHRIFIIFAAALTLLTACLRDDPDAGNLLRIGQPLPPFVVQLDDGTTYDSRLRDGRGATIVFFATWCADCQRELPRIDSLYRAGHYRGQHLVCISRAEPHAAVSAFWQEHHLVLPYSAQDDRSVYDLFARQGIPRIYTADAQGIITHIDHTLQP